MTLKYTFEWYAQSERMRQLHREQSKTEDDFSWEEFQARIADIQAERNREKYGLAVERQIELKDDFKEMGIPLDDIIVQYGMSGFRTVYCPFDSLEPTRILRKISPDERAKLEAEGYDVAVVSSSSHQDGEILIGDSLTYSNNLELANAQTEGHEAVHVALRGSRLRAHRIFSDEAKVIEETTADLIGNQRLLHYVRKHYPEDEVMELEAQKTIEHRLKLGAVIDELRRELLPYITVGDKEGGDEVLGRHSERTEERLGYHKDLNRVHVAVLSCYCGNTQVVENLTRMLEILGPGEMLKTVSAVSRFDELENIVARLPSEPL